MTKPHSASNPAANPAETWADRPLIFTLADQHVRGRVVRLGPTLRTILAAHAYPPVIQRLLAEALVLTALLGSTMAEDGQQLTLQAQTQSGPVKLLVCDYLGGQVRGYVSFDAEALVEAGDDPSLFALFGKGFLALTFDMSSAGGLGGAGERYQGIVPLEGHSLANAAETYFRQSEQLPTVVRIAVDLRAADGCVAGGIMIQKLAQSEEGGERLAVRGEADPDDDVMWEHVAVLAQSIKPAELTDPAISMEALVWRLYHDEGEVRVTPGAALSRGCRCDPDYLASVIARFPDSERADMVDDAGLVQIDCAFCSRQFAIDPAARVRSH